MDPLGLRYYMNEIYNRIQKPLFIVENGLGAIDEVDENNFVKDDYRIKYLSDHFKEMADAINVDGVHCLGYTGVIYAAIETMRNNTTVSPFKETVSYKQIWAGFFFAFGALTYLISAQPDMNGLATGFVLSQTSVALATLTGIWFLGQEKTKKEMAVTVIGLVLIIAGAAVTQFI